MRNLATVTSCLLSFLAIAAASEIRVETLGGEGRFLDDPINLFRFPASVAVMPHAEVALFDEWAGIAYPLTENHSVALFFNRPSARRLAVREYVASTGSNSFAQLQPKPWIDAFYAASLGRFGFGIGAQHLRDVANHQESETRVSATDLTFGMDWRGETGHIVEGALAMRRTNLEDIVPGSTPLRESEGSGWHIDLRASLPISALLSLRPVVSVGHDAFALEPERRNMTTWESGVGLNAQPSPRVLLLFGILVDYKRTELSPASKESHKLTEWSLPSITTGAEAQVGSLVFRLGVRNENIAIESSTTTGNTEQDWRELDSRFTTDLGMGLQFGALHIDGHLERDFLRDGPHIIGGSRHGGGIFSAVSITYHL